MEGEVPGVTYVTGWDQDHLRYELEAAVRDILASAEADGAKVTGNDIVSQLEFSFRGDSELATYLEVTNLFEFVSGIAGVKAGPKEKDQVAFGEPIAFGRAIIGEDTPSPKLTREAFTTWLFDVLSTKDVADTGLPLTSIGTFAREHFDVSEKVHSALKEKSLTKLLKSVDGVELYDRGDADVAFVRIVTEGGTLRRTEYGHAHGMDR